MWTSPSSWLRACSPITTATRSATARQLGPRIGSARSTGGGAAAARSPGGGLLPHASSIAMPHAARSWCRLVSVSSHEGEPLVVKADRWLGRRAPWLVVAILASVGGSQAQPASAAPRPASRKPVATRAPRAAPGAAPGAAIDELAQLDKDITAAQVKQANFAAAKLARRALALQIRRTGADSAEAQR